MHSLGCKIFPRLGNVPALSFIRFRCRFYQSSTSSHTLFTTGWQHEARFTSIVSKLPRVTLQTRIRVQLGNLQQSPTASSITAVQYF